MWTCPGRPRLDPGRSPEAEVWRGGLCGLQVPDVCEDAVRASEVAVSPGALNVAQTSRGPSILDGEGGPALRPILGCGGYPPDSVDHRFPRLCPVLGPGPGPAALTLPATHTAPLYSAPRGSAVAHPTRDHIEEATGCSALRRSPADPAPPSLPPSLLQYTSSMRAKYLATSQPRPDSSGSGH